MLPKGKVVQQQTEKFHCHGTKSQNANSALQLNETEQK
jgi:hypothetical protein